MRWFLEKDGELTPLGRNITKRLAGLYGLAILVMCFLPQDVYPKYKEFSTPGIVQIGRLYLLPMPFNTLINGHEVENIVDFFWVLAQNVTNIFLLFPLVLAFVALFPKWRKWQTVLTYSFFMSLGIECTQLLLDLLIDAGRVFEVDDLWTNSLGGLLAYGFYLLVLQWWKKKLK